MLPTHTGKRVPGGPAGVTVSGVRGDQSHYFTWKFRKVRFRKVSIDLAGQLFWRALIPCSSNGRGANLANFVQLVLLLLLQCCITAYSCANTTFTERLFLQVIPRVNSYA